jgi:hypothetical protein
MKVEGVKAIVSGAAKREVVWNKDRALFGWSAARCARQRRHAKGGTIIDSTLEWYGVTRYYEVYLPPESSGESGDGFDAARDQSRQQRAHQPQCGAGRMFPISMGSSWSSPLRLTMPNSGQWNWNAYDP